MAENDGKEKKIIIDEGWKKQAQAEKEKLEAEKPEAEEEKQPAALPKGDFQGLVSMLATQIFFAMGVLGDKDEKDRPEPNFELARYQIDLLGSLAEKTKGNLGDDEQKLLADALYQVRMIFVKLTGGK